MSEIPPRAARDATLDIAKALAIILIVLGHVWRALEPADLVTDPLLTQVDAVIYMSHLSVFAFVAGLFVAGGMRRDGPWFYARGRTVMFLWLYALWSTLQLLMKISVGSVVNDPVDPVELLRIWEPKEQFWFFGWISLMMLLTAVSKPWRSRTAASVTLGVAALGSLAVWGLNWNVLGGEGLALTIFFFAGVVLTGKRVLEWLRSLRTSLAYPLLLVTGTVWVLLGCTLLATPPTAYGSLRTVTSVGLGVVASASGVACVLAMSVLLSRLPGGMRWLARIGELSLVIFVAHVFFTASTRIGLSMVGIDMLWLHVVVSTVAGVLGPMLIHAATQRLKQNWVFEAPGWLQHLTGADRKHTRGGVSPH